MSLTVSFTSKISKRRGQVLVLLPRDYWQLFQGLRGRRVKIVIDEGFVYEGRITVIEGRVYATLPSSALALRERAKHHIVRVEV